MGRRILFRERYPRADGESVDDYEDRITQLMADDPPREPGPSTPEAEAARTERRYRAGLTDVVRHGT
jgi:hypothetical protein